MAIKPGTCGSRRRVVRLMRAAGLEGRRKKRWRTTTVADPAAEAARDLIGPDFAPRPGTGRRYVDDITHISKWQGLGPPGHGPSRKVVGRALATTCAPSLLRAH
jgi:transposase InsO family protein